MRHRRVRGGRRGGAHRTRPTARVLVHLPGGDLEIEWRERDGHVYMSGEAVEVFRGEVEV